MMMMMMMILIIIIIIIIGLRFPRKMEIRKINKENNKYFLPKI